MSEEVELYTWVLLDMNDGQGPCWWYDRGDKYTHGPDSRTGFGKSDVRDIKIVDTAQARHYEDLDHTRTNLVAKDSPAGWIAPGGQWHPCKSTDHDNYAWLILKKTVGELEDEGWVRVRGKPADPGELQQWFHNDSRITAEQRNRLSKLGHEILDWQ